FRSLGSMSSDSAHASQSFTARRLSQYSQSGLPISHSFTVRPSRGAPDRRAKVSRFSARRPSPALFASGGGDYTQPMRAFRLFERNARLFQYPRFILPMPHGEKLKRAADVMPLGS